MLVTTNSSAARSSGRACGGGGSPRRIFALVLEDARPTWEEVVLAQGRTGLLGGGRIGASHSNFPSFLPLAVRRPRRRRPVLACVGLGQGHGQACEIRA